MRRGIAELAPKLIDRRGGSTDADAARAFLDWLMADNYVMLGVERYTFGPDGQPHADSTTALGVFKDPALLPVVSEPLVPTATETVSAFTAPVTVSPPLVSTGVRPSTRACRAGGMPCRSRSPWMTSSGN